MLKTQTNKTKVIQKPANTSKDPRVVTDPIETAMRLLVPSWPLQHTVAVNPFWNQRDKNFAEVLEELAPILHTPLYMPLSYYVEAYRAGKIKNEAIQDALEEAKSKFRHVPSNVEEFIQRSRLSESEPHHVLTAAEFIDLRSGSRWREIMVAEIGKYAAAFFDKSQATVKFPWADEGFWRAWQLVQAHDKSAKEAGIGNLNEIVRPFRNKKSTEFIQSIAKEVGFSATSTWPSYLSRLLTLNFGWGTQFQYVTWQKALGYPIKLAAEAIDLLAVALAYDYAILQEAMRIDPSLEHLWQESMKSMEPSENNTPHSFQLAEIWLAAYERSYQAQVASQIVPEKPSEARPKFQLAMCIDVRSEMYRRGIERVAPGLVTIGFAGFFGIPFDYQKADEEAPGHRLPVLLPPAFSVDEQMPQIQKAKVRSFAYLKAYFRNLRKAPHASFLFVEVFGLYSLGRLAKGCFESLLAVSRPNSQSVPLRFYDHDREPACKAVHPHSQTSLDLAARIDRAATVLRHMGLRQFARLVVLAGHGSVNANNAFTSALDCGACGGHSGDINARFLANLLNDREVRSGLNSRGIAVPDDTWFVAAVHETVTDELYLLDEQKVPASHHGDVAEFRSQAKIAAEKTRNERQWARSRFLDQSPTRRSINWSEVRPEWGLAGNASFIVAPRSWTKGANFSSRSFLHDYDWRHDQDFKTLELIMTAPMLVTNWINLQYYGSTVAPSVYGAGNKVLHNLVNESGVLEGNGGSLRVGLPWQSVHDGERFTHEPLRLSVFIAAPREEIEKIIRQHAVVRELVDNEWLYILHIDEEGAKITRRAPGGLYRPI